MQTGQENQTNDTESDRAVQALRRALFSRKLAAQLFTTLALLGGITLLVFASSGCIEVIDAGHVGIKINKAGTETKRGVEDVPTVSGYVGYWPFTQNVLEYPVYEQPVEWGTSEYSPKIGFASSQGMRFATGVSCRYILAGASVPDFYRDYKITDMRVFEQRYLLPEISNAFVNAARGYTAEELIGTKAQEFMAKAYASLDERLKVMHVSIRHLGYAGSLEVPETVRNAIEQNVAKVQAERAAEADQKIATAQALRDKAIAEGKAAVLRTEAEGAAAASKARTDAAAYETLERAKADAEAVRLMAKQGSEAIELKRLEIQLALAQNWKGEQPSTVIGDVSKSGMILQLPAIK